MLKNLGYAVALLGYHPNATYLDLGCGYGLLKHMFPPDIYYFGVDIVQREDFVFKGDIREVIKELKKGDFDYIVCSGVYRYFNSAQECYDFTSYVLENLSPMKFLVISGSWGGEQVDIDKLPNNDNYNMKIIKDGHKLIVLYEVK